MRWRRNCDEEDADAAAAAAGMVEGGMEGDDKEVVKAPSNFVIEKISSFHEASC
jgi:hypothetical protein